MDGYKVAQLLVDQSIPMTYAAMPEANFFVGVPSTMVDPSATIVVEASEGIDRVGGHGSAFEMLQAVL